MPRMRSSIKDPQLYERLRVQGNSKEKAARIANAAAVEGRSEVGRRGGNVPDFEERTVAELRVRAKELGLIGYSRMRKPELMNLLRGH